MISKIENELNETDVSLLNQQADEKLVTLDQDVQELMLKMENAPRTKNSVVEIHEVKYEPQTNYVRYETSPSYEYIKSRQPSYREVVTTYESKLPSYDYVNTRARYPVREYKTKPSLTEYVSYEQRPVQLPRRARVSRINERVYEGNVSVFTEKPRLVSKSPTRITTTIRRESPRVVRISRTPEKVVRRLSPSPNVVQTTYQSLSNAD